MADGEDIQPLVCDNGTGMVKVMIVLVQNSVTIYFTFILVKIIILSSREIS